MEKIKFKTRNTYISKILQSKKIQKYLFLVIFSIFAVSHIFAVNFQEINLSNDDRLIYRVDIENYNAVFSAQLTNMSIQQLTAFPEKLYLTESGRTILALSRFGAMKIPTAGGIPSMVPGYPAFAKGDVPLQGRLFDISASNDGRWVLFIDPVSPGYGNLILVDMQNNTTRIISEKIELPASDFPARWSPDSRFFVYAKGGRIFYFPILSNLSILADERFRAIGTGGINSVLWGQQGDFYYITENILYRVINPELFTRAMYGDFLSIGNVVAVLPVTFNSNFDNFWIAPNSSSILINKGGKGLFFFLLGGNQITSAALPHVVLPYGAQNFNVLYAANGSATVLFTVQNEIKAWRFENKGTSITATEQERIPLSSTGLISPDSARAIFWGERGLELWNYSEWRLIQRLSSTPVFSCAWISNHAFISGNSNFIEEVSITASSFHYRRICLSSADEIAFEESRSTPRILARSGTTWFATDGSSAWSPVSNVQIRPVSLSSDRFRVFLEPQSQRPFHNNLMIRNLQSFGTTPLFTQPAINRAFVPEISGESSRNSGHTQTTAMQSAIKIALCFDLYDDDTGLVHVLSALHSNNIRATFFLNGDFIRRNPQAVKAIADAGHETASLFYAPIDLSDARYRITQAFITQGLARNEDEFNRVTGRELSVMWHPPFYRSSSFINTAAAAAGYITIERTIDPGDWLSREDSLRLNMRQVPPSEIIERIITSRHNGAIVPVRLGMLPGGRNEYLFEYIDVLLDALIRAGCEVVPVSSVVRR